MRETASDAYPRFFKEVENVNPPEESRFKEIVREITRKFFEMEKKEHDIMDRKEFGRMMEIVSEFTGTRLFMMYLICHSHFRSHENPDKEFHDKIVNGMAKGNHMRKDVWIRSPERSLSRMFRRLVDGEKLFEGSISDSFLVPAISRNRIQNDPRDVIGESNTAHVNMWNVKFAYKLAHFLSRIFKLTMKDFSSDKDKEFHEFLRHAIEVGYVSRHDLAFKRSAVDLFKRVNKEGSFRMMLRQSGDIFKNDLLSIFGVMGNFVEKFIEQLGVEKSDEFLDVVREYKDFKIVEELSKTTGFDNEEAEGMFLRMVNDLIRAVKKGISKEDADSEDAQVSEFSIGYSVNGEVKFRCREYTFTFAYENPGMSVSDPRFDVERASKVHLRSVHTGVPILDAFAELHRRMLQSNINMAGSYNGFDLYWSFLKHPVSLFVHGDLSRPACKQNGMMLLDRINDDVKWEKELIPATILHRRIVEMLLSRFSGEDDCYIQWTKFAGNIRKFVDGSATEK